MTKIQNMDNNECCQGHDRHSPTLLMGMQDGTATLEDRLVVSYETRHVLTIESRNYTPLYLLKVIENIGSHKIFHMDVHSSLIYNYQNLETTNISFKWIKKLCCV